MHFSTLKWGAAVMLVVALVVGAEPTWQMASGQRIEGKISAVYGKYAVISRPAGAALFPIDMMGDAELDRVAEFMSARPVKPPLWKQSKSRVSRTLEKQLVVFNGKKLVPFDPGTRSEPEFYLVYFGANWCPPCRAFSPDFVKEYQRLQDLAPGRFEVVFISSDHDDSEQLEYVRHVSMPWPVLRFSAIGSVDPLERWEGPGIPCLVVVTPEGDAIMHSYHGQEYVGPHAVLREFEEFLRATANETETKRALHRLAVIRHVRDAVGKSAPVAPYIISIDLRRYRTLELKQLNATLSIDEKGHVTDAEFEPQLPTVLHYQLVNDAEKWLFLPAVRDGKAQAVKVQLPLNLGEAPARERRQ
jgi:thiol-disulfide isomerase/thioredoxin